jgi:hypothetical protein
LLLLIVVFMQIVGLLVLCHCWLQLDWRLTHRVLGINGVLSWKTTMCVLLLLLQVAVCALVGLAQGEADHACLAPAAAGAAGAAMRGVGIEGSSSSSSTCVAALLR